LAHAEQRCDHAQVEAMDKWSVQQEGSYNYLKKIKQPTLVVNGFSLTPISLAFAIALSAIFCASSEEMLCFFTTFAIGYLPRLGYASRVDDPLNVFMDLDSSDSFN
jgi:hypothetical protein